MYHFSLKSPIMQICSHLWPSSTLLSTYHKMLLNLALKYLWNLLFTLSICLLYAIQWPLFRFRFNVWPPTVTPWLSPLSLALLASLCNPLSNDPWRFGSMIQKGLCHSTPRLISHNCLMCTLCRSTSCIHPLFYNDASLVLQCSSPPKMLLYSYFQSANFHLYIKTQPSHNLSSKAFLSPPEWIRCRISVVL